jgi:hypothetical protein
MYEAKRQGKGLYVPYDSFQAETVELVPAADADARMAAATGKVRSGTGKVRSGNCQFPLPSGSKSL